MKRSTAITQKLEDKSKILFDDSDGISETFGCPHLILLNLIGYTNVTIQFKE
ncbi:MAG TPA: hypothetical protein VFD80_06825 [Flavobacteriaceae bacterium]|nr:hypothetical protein [Flavobacteriaceae bacterium]